MPDKGNLRVKLAQVEDRRGPPDFLLLFLLFLLLFLLFFLLPLRRRVRRYSPHGKSRNRRGRASMPITVMLKTQRVPRSQRSRSIRRLAGAPRLFASVVLARLVGLFSRRTSRW